MKKLFISCPMKGRSEESIKSSFETMHKVAEIMFGQKLEVIQSYIEEEPPEGVNESIWYLAQSVLKLSEADYFIGVYNQRTDYGKSLYRGCDIEEHIARSYGIHIRNIDCRDYICFEDLYKKR